MLLYVDWRQVPAHKLTVQESIKPCYNFKITKKECRPKLLGRRDNLLEEIYITLKKVVR